MSFSSINKEPGLASRLAAGDEAAFEQVYNACWDRIYSLALAYLKSVELAQDAVQEVFLKLWARREQMAKVENLEAFVYTMGRNQVIDALKKKTAITIIYGESNDWLPDDLLTASRQIDLKELQKKIDESIEKLPLQQKNIFRMSREEGLDHKQIAERLGIEKTTVKNHMVRALNTLRTLLHEKETLLVLWLFIEELIKK